MRRPAVSVLVGALVLLTAFPGWANAQDATPEAERATFDAAGVSFDQLFEVTIPAPDEEPYTLVEGEIEIQPGAEPVTRTSNAAEAFTVEKGTIVFALADLEGEGRLIRGEGGADCSGNEGCDLTDFVGEEIVLQEGDTVVHAGLATYSLQPVDDDATPGAGERRGPTKISYRCGGGCG